MVKKTVSTSGWFSKKAGRPSLLLTVSTVPIKSVDEMGTLAKTFNSMIKDIKAARDQRELWTQTLEVEIAKKTEEDDNFLTEINLIKQRLYSDFPV